MSAKQYGIPTPIQFDRLYAGPLDKHEVFDSYTDALIYAHGSISYPGQTIGVKKSGLKEDVYVINQDKSLSRLMIQREDVRVILYSDKWIGECPYEQSVDVPYLESTDNCIISLGETVNDPDVVREIVNAKIGDTIQENGSIRFIARGSIPTVNIPITITIGSVVSAVEIPNNVNDNTNHTVVIAKKDEWEGSKPPYTQKLYVFGVRPDSNGTVGINPDSSYAQINKMVAATSGVVKYEQGNNYVTIAAMNSKPSRDLEVLVVWGDEIVVFENSDTLEDFNTTVELVLKANDWSTQRPYVQSLHVEGLSEYHTGAIGLSDICTPVEAETGLNAGLKLTEQGNGYVIIEATDILPTIDIPVYLTYGSNITIVPSPEYVGEANRHVDTVAYASKWIKTVNGWEQEVDVEGITSNSIGTMGLRNGATNEQVFVAANGRIKITKVYDNKVLLTANGARPVLNIPLCFVFGRNINVAKYPGIIGKVSLNATYLPFDDTLINSNLSNVQELLEYLQKNKINYSDVVDSVHNGELHERFIPELNSIWEYNKPLSARMGRYLYLRKINYDDIIDNLVTNDSNKPLSASMGKLLNDNLNIHSKAITNLQTAIGNTVIVIDKTKPNLNEEKYKNKNVLWINTEGVKHETYTLEFNTNGGTGTPESITGSTGTIITLPITEPTRSGYIFSGWNTIDGSENIEAGSQYIFNSNFIKNGKITLYASWTPSSIKVTLDNQSATSTGTTEFYYIYGNNNFYYKNTSNKEDRIIDNIITIPTKTGNTFNGYYTAINGNGVKYIIENGKIVESIRNYTDNVTLYAYWIGNTYNITYDANGGKNAPEIQTVNYGDSVSLSKTVPQRDGYTFLGWNIDKDENMIIWNAGDKYTLDSANILYAIWSPNIYSVILKTNNVLNNTVYYKYGTDIFYADLNCTQIIPTITIPTNDQLIFKGYYSSNEIQYISETGEFIAELYNNIGNITLTSKWGGTVYTVSYDVSGGEEISIPDQYGEYEEIITISSIIPTQDNAIFKGWKDLDNESVIILPNSKYTIKGDVVLYAQYNQIQMIDLMIDNNTKINSIYYEFSVNKYYSDEMLTNEIDSVTVPTKSGFTFNGYYSIDDEGNKIEYITLNGSIISTLCDQISFEKLYAEWI